MVYDGVNVGRLAAGRLRPARLNRAIQIFASAAAAAALYGLYSYLQLRGPWRLLVVAGAAGLALGGLGAGLLWRFTLAPRPVFTSIRARLLITSMLLVLFTGGAVSYFSTVVLMHREQADAVERLGAVTARKEGEIEVWLDQMQTGLDLFVHHGAPELAVALSPRGASRAEYTAALEHLRADLADTHSHTRLYEALYLIDSRGAALLSVGGGAGPYPPPDAPCIRRRADRPCLQPPRFYSELGRVAVVATEPFLDAEGRTLGLIAGYATMDALATIVSVADDLGDTGVAYLVDPEGAVLTLLSPVRASGPPATPPATLTTPGVAAALGARASGSGFYDDRRGTPVVGVYRWLPRLQVALLAEQDQAEAFQSSTTLINVHLGVTLILLTAAALTALFVVQSITAPLSQLSATAARIAGGALEVAAPVERNDEIGALARSFSRMTERLLRAQDLLERRVQRRTEELARANAGLLAENAVRTRAEQVVQRERNKLKSILDAIEDGVYIVSQGYVIEYANPTLEREFGPTGGRTCYDYMYGRAAPCPWCPNEQVWRGTTVRREEARPDGRAFEIYDRPLENADGTLSKLAIFHDVTLHKRAQEEILRRNRELAILSRQLVEIQERERHNISRELHDETGQALTSLMLRLGMLERDLHHDAAAADRVAELKHGLEEVLTSLHSLATDLRPPSLDHVGLVAALRQYVERLSGRHGLSMDFGAAGLDHERLPRDMEVTIYRIVQEALVNVVRHAGATHADVIVERRPGRLRVIIEDNGCGMEPAAALRAGRLGLLGMRERAEMLGGRLVIDSAPGAGTTVLMEAPYDSQHPDRR